MATGTLYNTNLLFTTNGVTTSVELTATANVLTLSGNASDVLVSGLSSPISGTDAVNKNYIDTSISTGTLSVSGPTVLQTTTITDLFISGSLALSSISTGALSVSGSTVLQTTTVTDLFISGSLALSSISTGALDVSGPTVLQDTSISTLTVTSFNPGSVSTGTLNVSGSSTLQTTSITSLLATSVTTGGLNVTGSSVLQGITAGTVNASSITTGTLDVSGPSTLQITSITSLLATSVTSGGLNVTGSSVLQGVTAGTIKATSVTTGTLDVSGPSVLQGLTCSLLYISGTVDSTSATSGALIVAGGLGVGRKLYVGSSAYAYEYNTYSDARIKTNINRINNSLDIIRNINGYSYNMPGRVDPNATHEGDTDIDRVYYGLMAQELENIGLGNIVSGSEGGLKSVNYISIIPLLIEAIKELSPSRPFGINWNL